MPGWWSSDPTECYWCEITNRSDIGGDLKCPQRRENGAVDWSYSLINEVIPGDVVFHYSTNANEFVGASVAGGPLEPRAIGWRARGTSARAKQEERPATRPGWWLPLFAYRAATKPLTLRQLQTPLEQAWITKWTESQRESGTVASPFQLYGSTTGRPSLRAAQGYLAKMPRAFVERWPQLSELADSLATEQSDFESGVVREFGAADGTEQQDFKPKNDRDYIAMVKGGPQRRTRAHERLVRLCGEACKRAGAKVRTPHPIDLRIDAPLSVIIEAKTVGSGPVGYAIRQAVGQLHEYRYFVGPRDAALCVLVNAEPSVELQAYVERELGFLLLWLVEETLLAGPLTRARLAEANLIL